MRADTRTAPDATLVVFAKAPLAGRVKTRLVPSLGEYRAARFQARLIERTVRIARKSGFPRVELHCTPAPHHSLFRHLAKRYSLRLRRQRGPDLGARMQRACESALRRADAVVLIGTDCPALMQADLRAARRALVSGGSAVFAPAEDGGYALIGLRRISPQLFSGIEWGGATVMQETRARLQALGWHWRELRTVWDVDRPEDYARLRRQGTWRFAA